MMRENIKNLFMRRRGKWGDVWEGNREEKGDLVGFLWWLYDEGKLEEFIHEAEREVGGCLGRK